MALKRKGWGKGGSVTDELGHVVRWATTIQGTARELRKTMTPAETLLWEALRRKQLHGLRFYRQVGIDRYVVDFYCPKKAVIIEVDGDVHDEEEQKDHDELREEILRERGFRILRVRNEEILEHIDIVLQKIEKFCGA